MLHGNSKYGARIIFISYVKMSSLKGDGKIRIPFAEFYPEGCCSRQNMKLYLISSLFSLLNYITFCSYTIPFHFFVPVLSSCISEPIACFILSYSVYLCKPVAPIPPKHLNISYIVGSYQFVLTEIHRPYSPTLALKR